MLFNSIEFALFLPVVFFCYWFVVSRNLKAQNGFILLTSYFFYGWWDWRFLSLIFLSSCVDYFIGNKIAKNSDKGIRKRYLALSLLVNLGLLGILKYFNFFSESFAEAFTLLGTPIDTVTLDLVLPVGISFYTFQTLSYSIDIYRDKIAPKNDFVSFLAFVSFFPQLVAGPIERASNLLPQFYNPREFRYENAVDGIKQLLWGLFKKAVIADNCAKYVDMIYESGDVTAFSSSSLIYGAILFSIQIYCDFSGYSDIAIGSAKLFGFKLEKNFLFPYFSRDMAEFWRRWHISLTTWFRDYIYIPLGGSKGSIVFKIRNTLIIFLISGFWHGANWTFLFWGLLNALYFIPLLLRQKNRKNLDIVAKNTLFPSLKETGNMLMTFGLATFAWIFFRSENLHQAMNYCKSIFTKSILSVPEDFSFRVLTLIVFFMLVEWLGRSGRFGIDTIGVNWIRPLRWGFYYVIAMLVFLFAVGGKQFIYFQF